MAAIFDSMAQEGIFELRLEGQEETAVLGLGASIPAREDKSEALAQGRVWPVGRTEEKPKSWSVGEVLG